MNENITFRASITTFSHIERPLRLLTWNSACQNADMHSLAVI